MSWYLDQIRILNNYQGTRDPDNGRNFRLGTDYSNTHTREKGCMLYIGDVVSGTSIALKAFLSTFSISLKIKHADKELSEGKKHSVKSLGFTYSMEVLIPSLSINDARVNATRLEMLEIMLPSTAYAKTNASNNNLTREQILANDRNTSLGDSTVVSEDQRKVVLLSNLINNGKYTNKKDITKFEDLETYGLECYFESISYSVNIDMGFFESDNKLWPKEYSLKLDLIVPTSTKDKSLIKVFNSNGTIDSDELNSNGSWPFGVATI